MFFIRSNSGNIESIVKSIKKNTYSYRKIKPAQTEQEKIRDEIYGLERQLEDLKERLSELE